MKFEVINDKNTVVSITHHQECIPSKKVLTAMSKAGHRLRLNGKIMSLKKILEQLEEISHEANN